MCSQAQVCPQSIRWYFLPVIFAGDFSVERPYRTQPVRAQASKTTDFAFLCLSFWFAVDWQGPASEKSGLG
jgi:hypothetical protein